jgi:hypothetical protein
LTQPRLTGLIIVSNTKVQQEAVISVMDYTFGEQAYETIDELLKPFKRCAI